MHKAPSSLGAVSPKPCSPVLSPAAQSSACDLRAPTQASPGPGGLTTPVVPRPHVPTVPFPPSMGHPCPHLGPPPHTHLQLYNNDQSVLLPWFLAFLGVEV